jgi:ABC-type amino acid transport substrate-binding protein
VSRVASSSSASRESRKRLRTLPSVGAGAAAKIAPEKSEARVGVMDRFLTALTSLVFLAGFAGAATAAGTLDTIRARGAMIIGYRADAAPFSSLGPNNKPQGYAIDLCDRIAGAVKTQLNLPKLPLRYVPVTAENRISKLRSGAIDIECGTTTRTISRQAQVDFTLFTFLSGTDLLVKTESSIHGAADLANKRIAVQPGTTTEMALKQLLSLRLIPVAFVPVQSGSDGLAALESGQVDAYASDEAVLIGLAADAKNAKSLRLGGTLFSYEPYAFMVRQNDAAFRLLADRTLALIFQNGEITKIYDRWFGQWQPEPPPLLRALYDIESLGP